MAVTEEEIYVCEEATSASCKRVLESGLAVRKCDETTTRLEYLELSSTVASKDGVVDDASIASWFKEVRNPKSSTLRL